MYLLPIVAWGWTRLRRVLSRNACRCHPGAPPCWPRWVVCAPCPVWRAARARLREERAYGRGRSPAHARALFTPGERLSRCTLQFGDMPHNRARGLRQHLKDESDISFPATAYCLIFDKEGAIEFSMNYLNV